MLTPHRWQEISPYLDEALAVPEAERGLWLAAIHNRNPKLGARLEELLNEHRVLAEERFLEAQNVTLPMTAGLSGQAIGAYTLVSEIGHGGMGTVWLAKRSDGRFERQVAIKFLNAALLGRAGQERFKREGSILGRLAHPHIADLIDAGVSTTGQPYLVLEYIEGEHIDRYCDQRRLDIEARVRLFLEVLAAIAHAHSNLIVHRDIKPSNVLVGKDGRVKLLDFGIAKLLETEGEGEEATLLTVEGGRPMTPEYAAPEQLKGGAITTSTDIYGLGVLLYVLLTGQHPAGAGPHNHADLVRAIVDTEPLRPSETVVPIRTTTELTIVNAAMRDTTADKLYRLLSGDLDTIVAKALKKDPRERYESAGALADDLRRYIRHEPIRARPDTMAYRAAKFIRRNRVVVVFASVAALATVTGVVGTLIQARTARLQRDFALRQVGRSAALNEFHEFLLSDAAPTGKPLTINGLLSRAEQIVARQHAVKDPNRVELMISIGRQYMEQDAAVNARRILEEAYKVSRGLSDPSIRAGASCALAAALARDEELPRAEALFQEGLRELPESPQFSLERIGCLQNGSEVAGEASQVWKAVDRAEAAQRLLRQSPFDSDVLEMRRWIDLAKAYSFAGEDIKAISAFERAGALLASLGRGDTDTAAVLFNSWALKLDQMGRPLAAEKMYRRSIDITRAGQTEEGVSPILLANYARSLRELDRLDEAADYAERAYAKAKRVNHQVAINQSLLERARIYTAQGKTSRAAGVLAEVEPRLRKSLPPGHYALAALASEKALNALHKGDAPAALQLANEAVAIDEAAIKAGGDGTFYLPNLLVRRSTIEFEAGRSEEASADAARALSLLNRSAHPGTSSSAIGHAYLALGRALQASGKRTQAHTAFQMAAEHLSGALGQDHSETRSAQQLAAGVSQN